MNVKWRVSVELELGSLRLRIRDLGFLTQKGSKAYGV